MKKNVLLILLSCLIISNCKSGALDFLKNHKNTITAGIAGITAATFLPSLATKFLLPTFIEDKFIIGNPKFGTTEGLKITFTYNIFLQPILTIQDSPERIYTTSGSFIAYGSKLLTGIITYKLVKNYLDKSKNQ